MCGIIACFNHPNAAEEIFLGAQQQQHRGQEGAGLVTHYKGRNIYLKRTGLINLHPEFAQLPGKIAAMHLRYSTQGESIPENLQPAIHSTDEGRWVLGSNGDLPFYWSIRQKYERKNWYFNTKNDAELLLRIITYHYNQLSNIKNKDDRVAEAIIRMQNEVQGAYSAFMLTPWGTMFIFRDPWAVRPLAYGQKNNTHYFSSETSAFDVLQVEYRRDVLAGEITSINQKLQVTTYEQNKMQPANCIFEYVYFARPDSLIFGLSSGKAKTALGVKLATKHPVDADIVILLWDFPEKAEFSLSLV
jgi:amidophosphoribosyltransferase